MQKIIVITAPSGSGKTTIVKQLLRNYPQVSFSVSACTRTPRAGERHGKDYYFLPVSDFKEKISKDAFIEWEMVYPGRYYGTLRSELERIWMAGCTPLIDIDVYGAMKIKEQFDGNAMTLFIKAPTLEQLKQRLQNRGTETPESLAVRLEKAGQELSFEPKFDFVVINDDLDQAVAATGQLIDDFLKPA